MSSEHINKKKRGGGGGGGCGVGRRMGTIWPSKVRMLGFGFFRKGNMNKVIDY